MRRLESGVAYSVRRERGARAALAASAGFGLCAIGLAAWVGNPAVAVLALLIGVVGAVRERALLSRRGRGRRGEALVSELLGRLPEGYLRLDNLIVAGHPGNLDHVVVGPCGVVVIETKHYAGRVEVRGNRWFVNGWPTRSASHQASRGAAALRAELSRHHPELASSALKWIDAVVVLSDPHCDVSARGAGHTHVARYGELLGVIAAKAHRPRMTPAAVRQVAATIAAVARPAARDAAAPAAPGRHAEVA